MRFLPASFFRQAVPQRPLYTTIFVGEHAHDAGGPYRESFAQCCAELQSSALPLLVRCPNAVNNVGINRDKWLPNPSCGCVPYPKGGSGIGSSPVGGVHRPRRPSSHSLANLHLQMYRFLGRLMGVACRSGQYLDLDLPSLVWKQLVGETLTREDLEAVDIQATRSIDSVRHLEARGVTEDMFEHLCIGNFTTLGLDGREAELKPGGSEVPVTWSTRGEYADLAEAYRLQECRVQVEAIRMGLGDVVPLELLHVVTWRELEVYVCGKPGVDVYLLMTNTDYSGCGPMDKHIRMFWKALQGFSEVERSLFLRFTWGRSRLPISAAHFHQRFKVQGFHLGNDIGNLKHDDFLPVAHTCFFTLDLPRYSSQAVLEAKLRYAIHNCQAIDADNTSAGRSAARMGFENEDGDEGDDGERLAV